MGLALSGVLGLWGTGCRWDERWVCQSVGPWCCWVWSCSRLLIIPPRCQLCATAFGSVLPSYTPGVHLTDLATALPEYAITAIREAIPAFAREIKGYDLADAVLTGVETRTSSPLRITRGEDLQSLNVKGLYPAGEGAGYAGGILSAGVDGIKVAEAVALDLIGPL